MPRKAGQKHDDVIKQRGDLQIEEDIGAQRRLWNVQKFGRLFAIILLVLAMTGVLGDGPLSRHAVLRNGSAVDYERIGYYDTNQTVRVAIPATMVRSGKAGIVFDNETLQRIAIEQIVPEPSQKILLAGQTVFRFDVEGKSTQPLEVLFYIQPRKFGIYTAHLGIENGPTHDLTQIVLP